MKVQIVHPSGLNSTVDGGSLADFQKEVLESIKTDTQFVSVIVGGKNVVFGVDYLRNCIFREVD